MATEAFLILGQVATAAATETGLYTVPALKSTVVSTIIVCNRGGNSSFRIGISPTAAALTTAEYTHFDVTLTGTNTLTLTLGITLPAGAQIRVRGQSANFTFSAYGAEITP